jgi:hypothetical protein
MARTKGVNKSQLVRDYLKSNPDAKANDVVAALKDQGHKITANLVYFLKGKSSAKKARKKIVMKAAKAAVGSGTVGNGFVDKTDAISLIRDVRALAQRAGGYEQLKELVDALAG